MLPGTLGTDDIVLLEPVDTLPAEYGMTVCSVQRVRDTFLETKAVSAVMRFPIHDVPRNAKGLRFLCHQRLVVSASAISGRHGGGNGMRTGVPRINSMIFKQRRLSQRQRRMPLHLRPMRTGHVHACSHDAAPLIIQAQKGRHTVSTS